MGKAKKSQLSTASYTGDDIDLMYESFRREGDQFILFLKSIQKLEFYEWLPNETKPYLLYRVQISTNTLTQKLIEMRGYIKNIKTANQNQIWSDCGVFTFESQCFDEKSKTIQKQMHLKSYNKDYQSLKPDREYLSKWIICNALGGL